MTDREGHRSRPEGMEMGPTASHQHLTGHWKLLLAFMAPGFPTEATAGRLRSRAVDMITGGFEYALDKGDPGRSECHTFPWRPPCCTWSFDPRKGHEVCSDRTWRPEKWQKLKCKADKTVQPSKDWIPVL